MLRSIGITRVGSSKADPTKNILSYTIHFLNTALMTVKGHTSLAYSTQYNHRSMQHDNKIVVRTQYFL